MYKTIADLSKKKGWNIRVLRWEDSYEIKSMLQRKQDRPGWYYVDFYYTNDYGSGLRIEGTKEDLQEIVDLLNTTINS